MTDATEHLKIKNYYSDIKPVMMKKNPLNVWNVGKNLPKQGCYGIIGKDISKLDSLNAIGAKNDFILQTR